LLALQAVAAERYTVPGRERVVSGVEVAAVPFHDRVAVCAAAHDTQAALK